MPCSLFPDAVVFCGSHRLFRDGDAGPRSQPHAYAKSHPDSEPNADADSEPDADSYSNANSYADSEFG